MTLLSADIRLAGTTGILFLGYVLPSYIPPLTAFVFDVLALMAWILVGLQWMRPMNLPSVSMRLAILTVVIPMASIALNLVFGRFGAWQQSVMAIFFLLTALCCALTGGCLVQVCYQYQPPPPHYQPQPQPQHHQLQRKAVKACFTLTYAVLAAAVFNGVVAVFQYLQLPLNPYVAAELTQAGRMFGNLRQPNHFAVFMVWGILCALGLQAQYLKGTREAKGTVFECVPNMSGRLKPLLLGVCVALLSVAVAMSSSRMGIGLMWAVAIACWLCPGMPRRVRILALFAACTHGIAWHVMLAVAENGGPPFYAATRGVSGLTTDSRYALWADGISLITQTPGNALWGVGYGLTNFALNKGDFSGLTKSNHLHNIFLQMALDFGLIIAAVWTLVVCLLARRLMPLYKSATGCLLLLGVGVMAFHSCLEYPLWYAHFLLPTAFVLGCLASMSNISKISHPPAYATASRSGKGVSAYLLWAMLLVPIAGVIDYRLVSPMYFYTHDVNLMQRVEDGYRSVWFRYLADYAAFTAVPVTRESAPMHYNLGLRVRAFDYNEQVAFQFMMAAAHLGKWSEAGAILRRLQKLHPKEVILRVEKLTPAAQLIYQEVLLRERS